MFKLRIIGVVLAAMLVAGCSDTISETVSKVAAATKTACSFAPTVASLTVLVNAQAGATVAELADKICAAIDALPGGSARFSLVAPKPNEVVVIVDGVVIEGVMTK